MSHVIGLDIGTSGIKTALMNRQGEIEVLLHEPYALSFPRSGWVELDPEQVWRIVVNQLVAAAEIVAGRDSKVDAVSLSTFCSCSVFMDETGRPVYPGIMYLDHRSADETEWIRSTVGSGKLFAVTKNRIEAGMTSATSLLWFKRNRPDLFEAVYKWGHLSTYILHRLTGEFVLDWTQASFTGMFDVVHYEWSPALYEAMGIPERILPDIVAPERTVGLLADAPHPLLAGIPVIAGAADTASSTLALGIRPGELFESVGTSDVLTLCTDSPERFDDRLLNRCHITRNEWLCHGPMSTPGASIQWYCKQFLSAADGMQDALAAAARSVVGANGVFFLPYMQGERAPVWDIHAKGVFLGLGLHTSKADLLQAIYEGCSFGLRQILEIIESSFDVRANAIPSVGGGAKNLDWAQIKANVLNKPIEIQDVSETAALGVCLLAAVQSGYFASLTEAVQSVRIGRAGTVSPQADCVEQYDKLYGLFAGIYPSLKDFFRKSSLVHP